MTVTKRETAAITEVQRAGEVLAAHADVGKALVLAYGEALRELRAARDAAMER